MRGKMTVYKSVLPVLWRNLTQREPPTVLTLPLLLLLEVLRLFPATRRAQVWTVPEEAWKRMRLALQSW